jgi:uncharacterized protein (UPF0548 family)
MFSFNKPSKDAVEETVRQLAGADYNYPDVGITKQTDPKGYNIDSNRVLLGNGASAYHRACEAIRDWTMFDLGWVEQLRSPEKTPIEKGTIAVVMSAQLGLYTINCSRIVYTIEDHGAIERFGFAYGTLPVHVEAGEERFLIEWDKSKDTVYYDVLAFSKPYHWLTKLGYPYARYCQRCFGRDTKRRMQKATQDV